MKRVSVRLWDFPSAAILVIAQIVVCERLIATGWTPDLGMILLPSLLGTVLGLTLGLSRFERSRVVFLALGYSLVFIPLWAAGHFYPQMAWLERMTNLGGRLAYTLSLFLTRRPVEDTILFLAFLYLTLWIIALTAGYALTRSGNFLGATLPAGAAIFLFQVYDSPLMERAVFLAAYAFLCLLLLGRMNFVRKRIAWKEQRVWFSSESGTDMNLTILLASLALVVLAWLVPATNEPLVAAKLLWEKISQPLEEVRNDLENAIAGLESNRSLQTSDFYGDELALGQQAAESSNLLFSVRLPTIQNVPRYYWRARTYNTYANGSWQDEGTDQRGFSPSRTLTTADTRGMITSEYLFSFPESNISILITPTHPVWVSRPAVLTYLPAGDKEIEPILFRVDPPIRAGEEYLVHAANINPTIKQLKEAGTDYPSWVTANSLQLPSDLPPAIIDLARQITAGANTPYDKAQAITQWLRLNITYTKIVPPTPAGRDTLAWFLFDHKAGFCNYYATAEVVMLRGVGVPARMAVGFAEGEYQVPDKRIIRQQDAHAWPEVYFPGIGWVEFEPTVSQAPLGRPSGEVPAGMGPIISTPQAGSSGQPPRGEEESQESEGTAPESRPPFNSLLRLTIFLGLSLLLIVGSWLAVTFGVTDKVMEHSRRLLLWRPLPVVAQSALERLSLPVPRWLQRWAVLASRNPIERAFGAVYQSLRWLGGHTSSAQTPAEAAAALSEKLPEAAVEIRALLDEHQHAQYSRKPGNLSNARRAADSIRRRSFSRAIRLRLAALSGSLRKFP